MFLAASAGTFFPSYSHPPPHYRDLAERATTSAEPGRANPLNEKIFIAASIYDPSGELLSGAWARAVLNLVDILGPDNVFVSIYENDPDVLAREAAADLKGRLTCTYLLSLIVAY